MNSPTSEYPSQDLKEGMGLFYDDVKTNTSGEIEVNTDKFISDATQLYFQIIVETTMCGCVSIVGTVLNIISIIVFIRQGVFADSGTAGLFGLTVSDLFCVVSMLWMSTSYAIGLAAPPDLSWNPWDITYLAAGWPHLICAQITRVVNAYIAFERCMCVVFPFKVKTLFTPRRSLITIGCIFVCFGLAYTPAFITRQFRFKHDPNTNTTRLFLVSFPDSIMIENILMYVNSMSLNICAVVIVLVCTVITVSRVNLSKAWRKSNTAGSSSNPDSEGAPNQASKSKTQREQRLVRMIVFISIIFLICYIPHMTYLLMFAINPEIRMTSRYENLAKVMYAFAFLMEIVNSSINIIIYYKMSTRFRQEFNRLFGIEAT